jgi:DDE superfamily endonuclease
VNEFRALVPPSETHPGRVHDMRIADTIPFPLPTGSQMLQETGVQACTLGGVAIIQPTKKPRGPELTPPQQARHRKISQRRVRLKHVNSRVTCCRRLQETLQMWNAGIRDMVMEIGCVLHNFRVRLTASWTPMGYIVMNSILTATKTLSP